MNDAVYNRGAIWFHWIIAALIIINIVIAFGHDALPRELRGTVMGWHKAFGVIVLLLSIGRIVWRLAHPRPPFVETMKGWEVALARFTHAAFYVLIVALPLSGWIWMSAGETRRPISFFGLFDIPFLPVAQSKAGGEIGHEMHELMGYAMTALVALHILAALKHQLVDKDTVLARMVPALRRG